MFYFLPIRVKMVKNCIYTIYEGRKTGGMNMGMIPIGKIRDEVIGVRPMYTETGNSTLLYLRSGEVLDERSSRSVMGALFQSYGIDQKAQRRNMEDVLQRHGVMPFYIGKRVFIPVKVRKPLAENDRVYGYVNLKYVKDVEPVGLQECILSLTDGRSIEVLSSRKTVAQSLEMGRRLQSMLPGSWTRPPDEDYDEDVVRTVRGFANILVSMRDSLLKIAERVAEDPEGYDDE